MTSHNVLLVDDDPGAIRMMDRLLTGVARTRFATTGFDALQMARQSEPNLILLDVEMPGMNGFRVCEELRSDRVLKDIPVIFVTSHDDVDFQVASFKLGATDYITKPLKPELALARITAHLSAKQQADDLRRLLTVDPATEVINRRGFSDALRREWRRALRSGQPLSLMAVSLDRFDSLRSARGDVAATHGLQVVARALTRICQRPADVVGRLSDHCFGILLPMTPRGGAEHVAHRVLDEIERLQFPHPASPVAAHVTASIGVGCYDNDSVCWLEPSPDSRFMNALRNHSRSDDLLQATEGALRAAKLGGRAQAWFLDVADADTPRMAREISAAARPAQRRGRSKESMH